MPLTDTAIRKARPGAKPTKLYDERGLFLFLTPEGSKWWRFRYSFDGKEKLLSLGVYPDVSLQDARGKRDEMRKQIAAGIDPGVDRKIQKTLRADRVANSFEAVAREWYTKQSNTWTPAHATRILRRFERDIFPHIGARPIADLTAQELLRTVKRIEDRNALETAHRALSDCGQVLRYAVATGRAERDISGDLRGALTPYKGEHFAAVTDPAKVGDLLRMIDGYQGTLTVRCALQLAPLVFARPGELRNAEWKDMDLDGAEWRYRVTKTDVDHIVPLSTQAVQILREVQKLTGNGRFVFPNPRNRDRAMSDNALLAALRRMGIPKEEMTGHGFRAMARTILDEVLGFRPDFIEHQLAHAVRDPNGRAYNRTAHLPERRKMMQKWADYLDRLKTGGADVVRLAAKAA